MAVYKGDEGNELTDSFLYPLSLNDGMNGRPCMRSAFGDVLARLDHLIMRRVGGPEAPSPEECLQTLLKGRTLYQEKFGSVSLAPFQPELVSLPP